MLKRKKRWSELTPGQRKAAVVVGAIEMVLTAIAASDLRQRPAGQVRGPKLLWTLALGIQPVGPIAYLVVGRQAD